MRFTSQAVSLVSGSFGIFCLWHSFTKPQCALNAMTLLITALALELARTREVK
jgi:hypothetical protein